MVSPSVHALRRFAGTGPSIASVTSFSLGQTPHRMTLVLSPDADFVATLTRSDGVDWPVGTSIELVVDENTPWAATVTGPSASWEIDEAVVGPVIAADPQRARLYHTIGDQRVMWASGPVAVR